MIEAGSGRFFRFPDAGMFSPDQYELIDFGDGRKLERFGPHFLDRPAPAADDARRKHPQSWSRADARFQRTGPREGDWRDHRALPESWTIRHEPFCFELKPTPFGHLGVFPEQQENWDWIAEQVAAAPRRPSILNLFAYTGGSTLAASASGAEVVHVDAAKNVVAWARRNAALSGLEEAPTRWLVEDARKFVRRETKRGNRYDAVILDPPSYGHGPAGQGWKIERDLPKLLVACAKLLTEEPLFLLLTYHSQRLGHEPETWLQTRPPWRLDRSEMTLTTRAGRKLRAGVACRWSYGEL